MINPIPSTSTKPLRHGITLASTITRIELNSGTIPADSPSYRPNARIPKPDWRPPTPTETLTLSDTQTPPSIAIIPTDAEIIRLSAAAFANVTRADSKTALASAIDTRTYTELLAAIQERASRFGELLKDPIIRISPPNLPTITSDNHSFIGLHVDEQFHSGQTPRTQRPNRIVFNLGRDPRYFLFLNIPVDQMPHPHQQGEGSPIGLAFMQSHPNYPVCRLRIDPGEAYLAPTENLVHDASSSGATTVDIAAHLLGHFAPITP